MNSLWFFYDRYIKNVLDFCVGLFNDGFHCFFFLIVLHSSLALNSYVNYGVQFQVKPQAKL